MTNEREFSKRLSDLVARAKEKESQITIEEVENYFAKDALTQEQMDLVFEYLLTQKITVKGYVHMNPGQEEHPDDYTEEEKLYLEKYLKELEAIRPLAQGELRRILEKIQDREEKDRLAELYLKEVTSIAGQMHTPGLFVGDLIAEGNLGLIMGIELLAGEEIQKNILGQENPKAQVDEILRRQICESMQMFLEEHTEQNTRDQKMVEKVQNLDESLKELTEELGRKVSMEELALYMGLEEEKIEDILKLAGEDIDEDDHDHDHDHCHEGHEHNHED